MLLRKDSSHANALGYPESLSYICFLRNMDKKEPFARLSGTKSEVGGWSEPGNLNGSCVRDPVAGALEFD